MNQPILMKVFFLAFLSLLICSCDGEDGRDGMDGADGAQGPPGPSGEDGEDGEDFVPSPVLFENKSSLEPLVALSSQFNYVDVYSLLSSTDTLSNGFTLVGAQDGAGFLADPDGDGYIYVVNAEDDYAVARIRLDANLNPIEGDYLLNAGVADFARQCSATMWEAAIHGGTQDIFLSASESFNYDVKALDPYIEVPTPTADFGLDALGEFAWENAVPLPQGAYAGSTVILGGDDDSDGSEGQITLYYSENGDADLDNGKIYVLRMLQVSDGAGGVVAVTPGTTYDESDLDYGVAYDFEFVEIVDGANLTLDEMEIACDAVFAHHFMRVEDIDYRKGSDENARNVFVAVTGRGPGAGTYNDWGTAYRLELSASSPLSGKITQIISGNTDTNNMDGNLPQLQSPDNICVTENFIYLQEDPNSFSRGHSSYIYQTDLNGNNPKLVLEMVIRADLAPGGSAGLSGEYGALTDISDKIGVPNTFLLNVQPHYWQNENFVSEELPHDEGGQIVILKGLPR